VSLDRRLRSELAEEAAQIDVEVERHLGAVEARANRRPSIGGATLLAVATVIALAIAFRVGPSTPVAGGPSPSPSVPAGESQAPGTSASPSYAVIAGTYTASLDPSNPAASTSHLGGTWTMRLLADGEMLLSPPATFAYGSIAPSGIAFSLVGDRFRTNLFYNDFCSSIGTYTWSLQGGRLSFAPIDETCGIRQTLLSTLPWQTQP
jgi:hypothetical protein